MICRIDCGKFWAIQNHKVLFITKLSLAKLYLNVTPSLNPAPASFISPCMPQIHVSPLADLDSTIARIAPSHVVSLLSPSMPEPAAGSIGRAHYLRIDVNDIASAADGLILAEAEHVAQILGFVRDWPQAQPLLMHCWFGVSRSPAAAYVAACALAPDHDEAALAGALRQAAPFATPNRRIVALGDALLAREGRMSAAIEAIGRGCEVSTGVPFVMDFPPR